MPLGADSSGEIHALAGTARYGLQEYVEAAENYERALKLDPDRRMWQEMLMQSRANVVAEVNVYVSDISSGLISLPLNCCAIPGTSTTTCSLSLTRTGH